MMIESYGATDVGLRRKLNEDSLFVDNHIGLFVVADGMGGHNAGEIASRIAVETVSNFVQRSGAEEEITWPYGVDPKLSLNANRLLTAVMLANKRVWKEADQRQDYTGMGTTIVAALADDDVISFVSAGDSRAYRLRKDEFQQITVDDSWVQAAVDEGVLLPEEAESHPMKNIITKAIGAKENIDITVEEYSLENDDLFLLCSDGLHGMVPELRLCEIVKASNGSLEQLVRQLIETANQNGGKDNVTALALRYRSAS
ncbi:MAG: Stp1/IreP family PP2C-type Ser/Thr phosphatase [Vicinamibacteria bacterium]